MDGFPLDWVQLLSWGGVCEGSGGSSELGLTLTLFPIPNPPSEDHEQA